MALYFDYPGQRTDLGLQPDPQPRESALSGFLHCLGCAAAAVAAMALVGIACLASEGLRWTDSAPRLAAAEPLR